MYIKITERELRNTLKRLGLYDADEYPVEVINAIVDNIANDAPLDEIVLSAAEGPINVWRKYRGSIGEANFSYPIEPETVEVYDGDTEPLLTGWWDEYSPSAGGDDGKD